MFAFFVLSLFLALSEQSPIENTTGYNVALDYKTIQLYKFKGIPELGPLPKDEKREIFHYQQAIIVRDSSQTKDNKVRRCEIIEVYYEEKAKEVLTTLSALTKLEVNEVATMDEMMKKMDECDSVDDHNEKPEKVYKLSFVSGEEDEERVGPIVPGTKWCGFGDIAKNYHDLGYLRNVDRCCRAHDLCPIKVLAKDVRYNLTNDAIYTKSHCLCDEALYGCLKKDNETTAKLIGTLYFTVASPQCIKGFPEKPEEKMTFVPATRKW